MTINGLIEAYNATPENFGVPSDEIINRVIDLVDRQMELDSQIEDQPQNVFHSPDRYEEQKVESGAI